MRDRIERRLFDFFGKSLSRARSKGAPESRALRLEWLESRELLSVSAAEFAALSQAYPKLDLPESAANLNVVEIQADELSLESIARAVELAASTPQDDLIVLRTSDANYQLDLGNATISIDVDSVNFGSITVASLGPRALQIATTSVEGAIDVERGDLALAGLTLVGFSVQGSTELVSLDDGASLTIDSVVYLTRSGASDAGYAVDPDGEIPVALNGLETPFTIIGSNVYRASQGDLSLGDGAFEDESWSIDFQVADSERAFLAGLSTEDAVKILNGTATFQTPDYYDADKKITENDGDDEMCWAATSSNMLYYTGWAPKTSFADEQAVFNVFIENYYDYGGQMYYGNGWFLEGGYDYWNQLKNPNSGGYYRAQLRANREEYEDYAGDADLYGTVSGITALSKALREGDAVGLGIDWAYYYYGTYVRAGGHAITCWGYTYDDSKQASDPSYYTRLFVTDSDDYQSEARRLQNYAITWSSSSSNGYGTGYSFDSYGRSGTQVFGFLRSCAWLLPKPSKYSFANETRLAKPTLTAESDGDSITVTIGAVENATQYELHRSTDSNFSSYQRYYLDSAGSKTFSNVPSGTTYYFRVKATAVGCVDSDWAYAYARSPFEPDAYEPNDTLQTAASLGRVSGSSSYNANLHVATDVDYYKFSIGDTGDSGHSVRMTYSQEASFDLDMVLYDSKGNEIDYSDNNTGVEVISLAYLPKGDYYLCVYNYYDDDFGNYSLTINAPVVHELESPVLSVKVEAPNVKVTFDSVPNATGYVLQYGTDPEFRQFFQKSYSSEGTYTLTNITPNKTTYFRIKASGPGWADSPWRELETYVIGRDLFEPNDAMASAHDLGTLTELFSNETLSLHVPSDVDWFKFETITAGGPDDYVRAVYDHVDGAFDLDFQIYDASGVQIANSTGKTGVETRDLNNVAAGTYYLKVFNRVNSSGQGEGEAGKYSIEISPPALPSAADLARPVLALVDRDHASLSIKIEPVANATGYVLQYSPYADFAQSKEIVASEDGVVLVEGLQSTLTYYVRVKATAEGYNDSAWATIIGKTTPPYDQYEPNDSLSTAFDLGTPTGVSVYEPNNHKGTDKDYFKFSLPVAGDADSYVQVEYIHGTNDIDLAIYDANGEEVGLSEEQTGIEFVSLDGFAPGDYYVYVHNYNESSILVVNYVLTISTPGLTILASPNLSVDASYESVDLTISRVDRATNYVVQYSEDPEFATYSEKNFVGHGVKSISDLLCGTTYYFRVKAIADGYGDSEWASVSATTLKRTLDSPEVTPVSATQDSITLRIDPVDNAAGYELEYSPYYEFDYALQVYYDRPGAKTLNDLEFGTVYYVRVRAVADRYESSQWTVVATPTVNGTLDAPTLAVVSSTDDSIVLDIGAVDGAMEYVVQYADNVGFSSATEVSYFDAGEKTISGFTGLIPGETYFFRVKARADHCDDSDWTYLSDDGVLEAPALAVSATKTALVAKIDRVKDASSYVLQLADNPDFANPVEKTYSTPGAKTLSGLSQGVSYYLRVKATANGFSDSAWTVVGPCQLKADVFDLAVLDGATLSATQIVAGERLALANVGVENSGSASSPAFAVRVYASQDATCDDSDALLGTARFPELGPGAAVWFDFGSLDASSLAPGATYNVLIRVVADGDASAANDVAAIESTLSIFAESATLGTVAFERSAYSVQRGNALYLAASPDFAAPQNAAYRWSYGDGVFVEGDRSGWIPSELCSRISGERSISVQVVDLDANRVVAKGEVALTVEKVAPTLDVRSEVLLDGAAIRLTASARSTAGAGPIQRWEIAWSDGATETIESLGDSATFSRFYASGVPTSGALATITLIDAEGDATTYSLARSEGSELIASAATLDSDAAPENLATELFAALPLPTFATATPESLAPVAAPIASEPAREIPASSDAPAPESFAVKALKPAASSARKSDSIFDVQFDDELEAFWDVLAKSIAR